MNGYSRVGGVRGGRGVSSLLFLGGVLGWVAECQKRESTTQRIQRTGSVGVVARVR
jgi:hypothetical protein